MDKKFIGSFDINDIYMEFQNHLLNNGYTSIWNYLHSDKYCFSTEQRFPIKRSFSKNSITSEVPLFPFIGTMELTQGFFHYYAGYHFHQCLKKMINKLDNKILDISPKYGDVESWEDYFTSFFDVMGINHPDSIFIEGLFRNMKMRLDISSRILSEEFFDFDITGERLDIYSYGSIFKLYFLWKEDCWDESHH